jgi:hypothetical protein
VCVCVCVCADTADKLSEDWEIQAFAAELVKPRDSKEGPGLLVCTMISLNQCALPII